MASDKEKLEKADKAADKADKIKKAAEAAKPAARQYKQLIRIMNTDTDGATAISAALKNIRGIGFQFANAVCIMANVDKMKKAGELSETEMKRVEEVIKNPGNYGAPEWMLNRRRGFEDNKTEHLVTGDLDYAKDNDIKRMKKIRCYKGIRHTLDLPVRGQRTKSNFRKNKGKVMGVKRSASAKSGGKT